MFREITGESPRVKLDAVEALTTHARQLAERARGPALRIGACALTGFFLSAPLAFEQAVENTSVQDDIAGFPTVIEYTHQGESQIDLGVAGRVYIPETGTHGIGVSIAPKDLPYEGKAGVYSLFSSGYVAKLAGLYDNPEKAAEGVVSALEHDRNRRMKDYELLYGSVATGTLLAGSLLLRRERRHEHLKPHSLRLVSVAGIAALAIGPSLYAYNSFSHWEGDNAPISDTRLPLQKLGDTSLADITVSNVGLQFAINDGADKVKLLLDRQQARQAAFIAQANRDLLAQSSAMHPPQPNETVVLVGSDMHDNEAMTELAATTVDLFNERFGENRLNLMVSSGDLGYGSSLEKRYIDAQAKITYYTIVSPGNHDTSIAEQEIDDAGMLRIKDEPVTVGDVTVVGGEDPLVTPFGGPTVPRQGTDGENLEAEFGANLYEQADEVNPDVVAVHEGYAAGAFLGLQDVTQTLMAQWFEERGSNTVAWEDGVRDLPTGLLIYGHWHRVIQPRTVWNSDGSWTVVMELNTMGGAIGAPTINHFSTPNDAPGQTASFPFVYTNTETGLVTGYQMYTFEIGGKTTIGPFVSVGSPGGKPLSAGAHVNNKSAEHLTKRDQVTSPAG